MYRTAILGAFLLIAMPLAPMEIPALFDWLTLKAELDELAGGIQGLSAAHISANPSRREVTIEGLVLRRPDLALRIGHLTLRLSSPRPSFAGRGFMQAAAATDVDSKAPVKGAGAGLAQTGTISADDVTIETAALHAVIKHIDMEGTRLDKADLDALFDTHAHASAAERLAKISAAHVAISEIVLKSKPTPQDAQGEADAMPDDEAQNEKIVLRDIAMDEVAQGRAGSAAIGATTAIIHSPEAGEMQAAFGPTRITGLDLVQAARLLSATSFRDAEAPQTICDSLDIDGVKISVPKAPAELGVGTVAIKDVKARSLPQLLRSGDGLRTGKPATERATAFAQLMDGFAIGSLEFTDLRFAMTNGTTPWTGRIGRGHMTQMVAAKIAEAGLENFTIAGEGAKVKIGRLGWHELDLAAKESGDEVLPNKIGPNDRAPSAEQQKISADTLDIDVSNLESYQPPPGAPTHFQLGHFELTSSDAVDGIPTRMNAAFDHFVFGVGSLKDGELAEVARLGYDKLDLSSRLAAHFSNTSGQLDLDALSLRGVDMGSIRISGRFDHVTNALFSSDQSEMEAGLLGVLLRRVEIRVENAGLFERLVAAAAKKDNTTPAKIRKKFTDAATAAVPALLDNGRGADVLAEALAKFIARPKNFRLAIRAPQGIGALELALIRDPAALLQQIEIEAAADE